MLKNILLFSTIIILFIRCDYKKKYSKLKLSPNLIDQSEKREVFSEEELRSWYAKDIEFDTVPGISLYRANDSLLKNREGEDVVIAFLDSEIDINHEVLEDIIWENVKETPNNGIDDDDNGYIDDVNGWNFLGNMNGENNSFTSYEFTRFLKKYDSFFKEKKAEEVGSKDSILYETFIRAQKKYKERVEYAKEDIEYANMLSTSMFNVKKELAKYFLNRDYTLKDLDSLKEAFPDNKELQRVILIRTNFIKYGFTQNYINNYKLNAEERVKKLLNLSFNDRKITKDNPDDINDFSYGNKFVNKNINLFEHGTELAGVIANFKNKKLKIMPVCISPFGDEHDKDIALAIRYAVDNGAKVINMSFGKEFSLHTEWVFSAFKYAEKNNVLIISSAGNSKFNLNIVNDYYPNDNIDNGKEISDNFVLVGAISKKLGKKFLYRDTNYGNIDVDLFAPGQEIYTAVPNNKYKMDNGTSLSAAITSGVAALIYSYYPNLTASQIKHILMDSGLEYTFEVSTPTKEDKNKTTPFNQLSKSGKVLNAYNALIMADSISRN
ncbi:peptidase S8 [Alteromonas sp. KUL156]|nr:peptidase S8 [Alteromonas sp. KUL154]GFE02353.1 peptidase S8 [Alteromonas sp. KUL156]